MRDILARKLVTWGLLLATDDGRLRIMHTISDHWRHAVRERMRANGTGT